MKIYIKIFLVLFFILILTGNSNAEHIPRISNDRLAFQDSWTYTQSLERSKHFSSLAFLLDKELTIIEIVNAKLQKGLKFEEGDLEVIQNYYKKIGSDTPLKDYLIRNRIDDKKQYYDLEGRVFILDDLAEIYSKHLVDFKKAQEFNDYALSEYNRIKSIGLLNIPVSDYYNIRRSLFYYFIPLTSNSLEDINNYQLNFRSLSPDEKPFYKRIDLGTLFSEKFLNIARENDIERLKERVIERKSFLEKKLGLSAVKRNLNFFDQSDIDLLNDALDRQNLFNTYYKNWFLAQKIASGFKHGEKIDFQKLAKYSQSAIGASSERMADDIDSYNELKYWAGLSNLKIGNTNKGLLLIEDFIQGLDDADKLELKKAKHRISVLQKLDEEKIKNAETTRLLGSIVAAGISIMGPILAANSLSQGYYTYDQAIEAIQTAQLITNVSQVASQVVQLTTLLATTRTFQEANIEKRLSGLITPLSLKVGRYLNKFEQVDLFSELGRNYKTVGNELDSIKFFKEALAIIEKQRATIHTENQRISFSGLKDQLYGEIITLLVNNNNPKEAFKFVERAKSRALLDILGSKRVELRTDVETKAFNNILLRKDELSRLINQTNFRIQQLDTFEKKSTRGIKVVKAHTRGIEFETLSKLKTISFSAASELSTGDYSIVEYFIGDNYVFLFLFDKGNLFVEKIGINKNMLYDLISNFLLESKGEFKSDAETSGEKLYQILIQPLVSKISKKRIYIIPHSWLHYIPFQALKYNSRYVAEDFAITYAPSVTILKIWKKKKIKNKKSILVLGNPYLNSPKYDLPYAEEEALSIGDNFQDKLVLVRKNATETKFKEKARFYNYIHIASHATFDPEEPLESLIMLSKDSKNDGNLTASDFYKMKLNATLLTLSACSTGLSYVSKGDEMIGLIRGVMYSGVSSILSSLWEVSDQSTAHLMKSFYKNLRTMPKDLALQNAQLYTMKTFPGTFDWSPFILSGNNN
jgi:CHAT domain-containing protein